MFIIIVIIPPATTTLRIQPISAGKRRPRTRLHGTTIVMP
jgi:hypothetical protein